MKFWITLNEPKETSLQVDQVDNNLMFNGDKLARQGKGRHDDDDDDEGKHYDGGDDHDDYDDNDTIMMMMSNDDDLAGPRKRHHGSWSEGPGHSCLPGGTQPDQVKEALAGETSACPEFLLCRFLSICSLYK